jgi:hypothetical protein
MDGDIFHKPEVQIVARRLAAAQNATELGLTERLMGESLYGIRAIVSLPVFEHGAHYRPISLSSLRLIDNVIPYLQFDYLYFIHHERLELIGLGIDYSVSFDTNYASYVKQVVAEGSLKGLDRTIMISIDRLLKKDVNFDLIFYFIENIKLAYPAISNLQKQKSESPMIFGNR